MSRRSSTDKPKTQNPDLRTPEEMSEMMAEAKRFIEAYRDKYFPHAKVI